MARTGSGPNLGAAVHALMAPAPPPTGRSLKQQINYLTSRHTGASTESLLQQLGVTERTFKLWQRGARPPSKRNRTRVGELYARFWEINHRNDTPGNAPFRVYGWIEVNRVRRPSILIERSDQPRHWSVLRNASDAAISADDGALFIDALEVGIPYLAFPGGDYTMTLT